MPANNHVAGITRKGYTARVGKSVSSQRWTEFAPPWLYPRQAIHYAASCVWN